MSVMRFFFKATARAYLFGALEMFMKKLLFFGLLISSISMLPFVAMADHPPKRLLRNFMAFSELGETGKLGKFDVNVAVYGALPKEKTTTKDNPVLDKIFADKFLDSTILYFMML